MARLPEGLEPEAFDVTAMRIAVDLAKEAAASEEAPVGAVIIDPATRAIVSKAHNRPIGLCDPTAHAEVLAIRAAGDAARNYRLPGLWLYCTLEPCAMCAGAISHARIGRVIYGAPDPKGGAVESGPRFFEQPTCHWRPDVTAGVLAAESSELLKTFFRARRS